MNNQIETFTSFSIAYMAGHRRGWKRFKRSAGVPLLFPSPSIQCLPCRLPFSTSSLPWAKNKKKRWCTHEVGLLLTAVVVLDVRNLIPYSGTVELGDWRDFSLPHPPLPPPPISSEKYLNDNFQIVISPDPLQVIISGAHL